MVMKQLDPRLRRIQQAEMRGKVVLVRVDHNVVKKGRIKDPYRIEVTLKTLFAITANGGHPILMTHIGRPREKGTGTIQCRALESVEPIVKYLRERLPIPILVPDFPTDPRLGIRRLDGPIRTHVEDLKKGKIGMIYLPNIRWFQGEQASGAERERLVRWLSGLADLYVNDAFGSWRAHGSTYDIAKRLPSYAGFQLQKELINVQRVLDPQGPFVAVVAGAKYDTKIGPLTALYRRADHMILGGLIYNVYLAAKYDLSIAGVSEQDKEKAKQLVELERKDRKILEMAQLVESDTTKGKIEGHFRTVDARAIKQGEKFKYLLDVDPVSFEDPEMKEIFGSAKTIFVNAVMGLTPPFFEGTQALYRLTASNRRALKLFAGGDTLQELRSLSPEIYLAGSDASDYFYFTGGGSVLTTLEKGSPYKLKPVEALLG